MEMVLSFFQNIWKHMTMSTVVDWLDLIIVVFLVYKTLQFLLKSTVFRAFRTVVLLFVVMWLTELCNLNILNFLLRSTLQVGILAVIILFQPELRRMLEQMSASSIQGLFEKDHENNLEYALMQTVDAVEALAKDNIGALILFERKISLADIVKTGTMLDAAVTAELLKNVFYPKAPLHDGAAIIRQGRLAGAGCVLPLTSNPNLSKELGMRHRAGLGASERSDALVVVVSEESGTISVATEGMLKRHLTPETLEKILRSALMPQEPEPTKKGLARVWRKRR